MTALATTVLDRLTTAYPAGADPERAAPMRAYMRDLFPFLGIPSPQRRALTRQALAGLDRPSEDDLRTVAEAGWRLPEREYQYFVCDWLSRHVKVCSAGFITVARHLITTKSWWDTVDALAADVVGPLVRRHPELVSTMDEWVASENLWLTRTAILHQLKYRDDTDAERLFRYCRHQADHRDFFIRKAIGWALRQYARTDPDAVRTFLDQYGTQLSPLSVREASKWLTAP